MRELFEEAFNAGYLSVQSFDEWWNENKCRLLHVDSVTCSALTSAYDVCFTMKDHCDNVIAGADEKDSGYYANKEMSKNCGKYIKWYKRMFVMETVKTKNRI